jgi:glutathione peroxidase
MAELSRRLLLAAAPLACGLNTRAALAAPPDSAWAFSFPSIEEGTLSLASYRGQVLLVTNTASFCGFTYEYEGLQTLYSRMSAKGLTVIGVPSQDFNQESDSNAKVKQFCEATFGIEFPMAGLSHVRGPQAAPFYAWVRSVRGWQPDWNFNKVLIGRDGQIRATFGAADEPGGTAVQAAIATALA